MSRPITSEVLPERIEEHAAVKAWRQIQQDRFEPKNIQILKLKRKSSVYRLTGDGVHGKAVIAKRCRATTAVVERLVYEQLARLPVPALRCYGLVPEPEGEFGWLFLDDAGGYAYSPDNAEHRALAGRWLGEVHGTPVPGGLQALLPDRGPDHYEQRLRSTRTALLERVGNRALSAAETGLLRTVAAQCDIIEAHWSELKAFCERWPRALVHGDFVIKNLRIQPRPGPALLVFDWEMAGWGLPASDLAQFVGNTVTPDLEVYCSVLRQNFPNLGVHEIQRLANYGTVLRVLDKIFWETVTMVGDSYEFLVNPLLSVKKYQPQLGAGLGALGWSRHD